MVRRVVLTSGIRGGCGLLYRETAKAVTRRCPPEGFLTRNGGSCYSTIMPRSSGRPKTLACSSQSNIACSSTSWFARVLRNAPFAQRALC